MTLSNGGLSTKSMVSNGCVGPLIGKVPIEAHEISAENEEKQKSPAVDGEETCGSMDIAPVPAATTETAKSHTSRRKEAELRECRSIASAQFSYSSTNLMTASSMPITPNCLLGSFEESLLNGRMNPMGIVDGFYAEIGASGAFFPEHATLPVRAAFYQVCEDVAASPYLGVIDLSGLGKRGYRVPTKGTIQVVCLLSTLTFIGK